MEFRCVQCGNLLRIPDEAIGLHIRCPRCFNVQIPGTETPVSNDNVSKEEQEDSFAPYVPSAMQSDFRETGNPYQVSTVEEYENPRIDYREKDLTYTKTSVREVISLAWSVSVNRYERLLLAALIITALTLPLTAFGMFLPTIWSEFVFPVAEDPISYILFNQINIFFTTIVSGYFLLGAIRFWLELARGEEGNLGSLFVGPLMFLRGSMVFIFQQLVNLFLSQLPVLAFLIRIYYPQYQDILSGRFQIMFEPSFLLPHVLGFVLSMILYFAIVVRFSWAEVFLVDGKSGISGSLSASFRYSRRNHFVLSICIIFMLFASMFGSLLSCCMGSYSIPIVICAAVYSSYYLCVTGQHPPEYSRESGTER